MHQALTEAGWTGEKVPREIVDAAFAMIGVAGENARLHIVTGEGFGLWARTDGGTRRGSVRIHPSRAQEVSHGAPILA